MTVMAALMRISTSIPTPATAEHAATYVPIPTVCLPVTQEAANSPPATPAMVIATAMIPMAAKSISLHPKTTAVLAVMYATQPMPAVSAPMVPAASYRATLVTKTVIQASPTAARLIPKPMKPTAELAAMCVTQATQPGYAPVVLVPWVHATVLIQIAMAVPPMAVK